MNVLFSQGRTALPRAGGRAALRTPKGEAGQALRSSKSEAGPVLRSSKSEAGFTLIELIAVMTIIAILSAIVIGGVVLAGKKAAVSATTALLGKLSIAINEYHEDYGAYPPDGRPTPGGWSGWYTDPGANLNMPAETLRYFLSGIYEDTTLSASDRARMARKSPYLSLRERDVRHTGLLFEMTAALANQGDPTASKGAGSAIVDNDIFPEIVDTWGMPINYLCKNGYARDTSGNALKPKVNTESFDLVSRGPDRLVGSDYSNRDQQQAARKPNRDNITNFSYE